jgi:hypothetical protein
LHAAGRERYFRPRHAMPDNYQKYLKVSRKSVWFRTETSFF